MKQYVIISSRHGRLVHKYDSLRAVCRAWYALHRKFERYGIVFYIEAA